MVTLAEEITEKYLLLGAQAHQGKLADHDITLGQARPRYMGMGAVSMWSQAGFNRVTVCWSTPTLLRIGLSGRSAFYSPIHKLRLPAGRVQLHDF